MWLKPLVPVLLIFFIVSIVSDYLRRGGVLVWSGLISFLSKVNKIDESDGST